MDVDRIKRAADWSSLASVLSGRDCDVRFEDPAGDGWIMGKHWKLRGKSIIQISPDRVDDDQYLYVYLHEVAHSKIHFPELHDWQSKAHYLKNGQRLDAIPAEPPTAKHHRHEDEADALAARWLGWVAGVDSLATKAFTLGVMGRLID